MNLRIFLVDSTTNPWFWITMRIKCVIEGWGGYWEIQDVNTGTVCSLQRPPDISVHLCLCHQPSLINKNTIIVLNMKGRSVQWPGTEQMAVFGKPSNPMWTTISLLSNMPNHGSFLYLQSPGGILEFKAEWNQKSINDWLLFLLQIDFGSGSLKTCCARPHTWAASKDSWELGAVN